MPSIDVTIHLKPIGSAQRSERYDRDFDDIFELQDEVARQVVDDALKIEYSERRVGALSDAAIR